MSFNKVAKSNDTEEFTNKILVGDALEILKRLPSNFVDVTVTSPPYNKGERHKGWLVDKIKYDQASDNKDESQYQQEQIAVLNELYRITKPGGSLFYNHKIRWTNGRLLHPYEWVSKSQWILRQEIIWNRKIAANLRGWRFWQVEERIYWLYKPRYNGDYVGEELAARHALLTSVWEIRPERKSPHPSAFPIELPVRCIFSVLDGKKGLVLDPYCGSGTTLVAAKLLGCDYLGIEISERYASLAQERLKHASKELPRVEAEMSLHKVKKTFSERKKDGEWDKRKKNKTLKTKGDPSENAPLLFLEIPESQNRDVTEDDSNSFAYYPKAPPSLS